MRRRVSKSAKSAISAAVASAMFSVPAWSQSLTAVVTGASNATINLTMIANLGISAATVPIDAATIAGDDKLYIANSGASAGVTNVLAFDPISKTSSTFLSFSAVGANALIAGQGVQGIAFSPNYNDPTKPGYHKFYTYEEETTVPGTVQFLHPEVAAPGNDAVLREWTANAAGTAINTAVGSRVVFDFGTPAGHMGGGLKFGPDGYLYLSTGDGGGSGDGYSGSFNNAGDGFTGRGTISSSGTFVPAISNGQDFTNMLGKVIRIDPYVTNGDGTPRTTPAGETAKTFSSQTTYFIPNSNPFFSNTQNLYFANLGPVGSATPSPPLQELWAIGFRNPWKLSFDKNAAPGAAPFVANVGSHAREEIELVQGGKDYGWPYYEGDIISPTAATFAGTPRPGLPTGPMPFLKKTGTGSLDYAQYDLDPTLTDPSQMSGPIARLGTRSVTSSLGGIFTDHPAIAINGVGTLAANDIYNDGAWGDSYGDTDAVVGGFIYRGSAIPSLYGMYVFGGHELDVLDPAKASYYGYKATGGRMFYFDPSEGATYKTVKEFNYDSQSSLITQSSAGDLLSVAQADNGELYGLFGNGDVKKINPNPGWNVDSNGSWSSGTNWSGTVPSGINSTTYFGGTITAPRTVTVDGIKTVGALNFDNINGYTLAGSTITMDVSGGAGIRAGINVTTGNQTISAPVVLNDNTVFGIESGTATLFMTGSLTATGVGVYKEGAGIAQFENIRAGSLTVSQGTARIRSRGSFNSTDGVSRVGSLTIAPAGKLDLQNNAMVIDYTSPGTLVNDLRNDLHSGMLTGTPDPNLRLGYGDNASLLKNSFEGQDVSSHSNVLIKYTYAGDLNLDGQVDMTDLQILAHHWGQQATWTTGDIDYDGVVGYTDLSLLAPNWQAGVSNPLPASSLYDALASLGLPTDVVPEPATASLIMLGVSVELGRRRRRRDV